MGKAVLLLSLIGISLLFTIGLVAPNHPAMWLASTSLNYEIVRAVLIVLLLGLLITNPPRNVYFRMFVGIVSTTLAAWTLNATYNNAIYLLDSLAFLQFSISAGLVVLERTPQDIFAPTSSQETATAS